MAWIMMSDIFSNQLINIMQDHDLNIATVHMAYQPVGGHGLRHAVLFGDSVFSTDMQSLRDRYQSLAQAP
jgi:hypothetical protein